MWDSGLIDEKLGLELSRDDENVLPLVVTRTIPLISYNTIVQRSPGSRAVFPHSTPPNQNSVTLTPGSFLPR